MLLQRAALFLLVFAGLALCAENFYDLFELSRTANDKEIKAAYRKFSKKYHPDKNPGKNTEEKFRSVAEAYRVLINPGKRKLYDKHGTDYIRFDAGSSHSTEEPFDLFRRFFGGTGHYSNTGQSRGPNVEVKVGISLRDFYNGRTTEFSWDKQHVCDECDGTGAADKHVQMCDVCGGRGVRVRKQQIAPGMFQQIQTNCDTCGGRGSIVNRGCPVCLGKRVVRKPTSVQLEITRGAAREAQLVYENEADEDPDYVAGDLVVTLVEKEPSLDDEDNPDRVDGVFFRRKGDDLYWREVLSLREAWMGDWSRNLTHLDGHVVRLGRNRGEVVQPGHVDTIPYEGMPKYHKSNNNDNFAVEFGELFVEYVVVLPDQMDPVMTDEFWSLWQTWRDKIGVDLMKSMGRADDPVHESEGGGGHREL